MFHKKCLILCILVILFSAAPKTVYPFYCNFNSESKGIISSDSGEFANQPRAKFYFRFGFGGGYLRPLYKDVETHKDSTIQFPHPRASIFINWMLGQEFQKHAEDIEVFICNMYNIPKSDAGLIDFGFEFSKPYRNSDSTKVFYPQVGLRLVGDDAYGVDTVRGNPADNYRVSFAEEIYLPLAMGARGRFKVKSFIIEPEANVYVCRPWYTYSGLIISKAPTNLRWGLMGVLYTRKFKIKVLGIMINMLI
jgi:hypothetical protein